LKILCDQKLGAAPIHPPSINLAGNKPLFLLKTIMNATILYISKSGKSATVSVTQELGDIVQTVTGFVGLNPNKKYEVKQVLDIPATKVRSELRRSEDGTEFSFLVFE